MSVILTLLNGGTPSNVPDKLTPGRRRYFNQLKGKRVTASELAVALGMTYEGCYAGLFRLEREGLAHRCGVVDKPGHVQYYWTWGPDKAGSMVGGAK